MFINLAIIGKVGLNLKKYNDQGNNDIISDAQLVFLAVAINAKLFI